MRTNRKLGLSVKELGNTEYNRRWRELTPRPPATVKPRWTGLSKKQLGSAEYNAEWRRLRIMLRLDYE